MASRPFFPAAVVLIFAVFFGGLVSCTRHLPLPSAVSRIEVKSNQNKTLLEIRDLGKIRALILYLSGKSEGWHKPSDPIPSASVILHLYMQEERVGEFSIGENFLMASWDGVLYSKIVKEREKRELLDILGL